MSKKTKKTKTKTIKRQASLIFNIMDRIYLKHQDTKPMCEDFYNNFKMVCGLESYLHKIRDYGETVSDRQLPQSNPKISRMKEYKRLPRIFRITPKIMYLVADKFMKDAYETLAKTNKPTQEEN
jgi:hypothetical protein